MAGTILADNRRTYRLSSQPIDFRKEMRTEESMNLIDINPEDFFRTNDMAAVTYLKLRGHSVQAIGWQGQTCYWIFRVTDALLEDMEVFSDGAAQVEPREYNRAYALTKREFYDSKSSLGRA